MPEEDLVNLKAFLAQQSLWGGGKGLQDHSQFVMREEVSEWPGVRLQRGQMRAPR